VVSNFALPLSNLVPSSPRGVERAADVGVAMFGYHHAR